MKLDPSQQETLAQILISAITFVIGLFINPKKKSKNDDIQK